MVLCIGPQCRSWKFCVQHVVAQRFVSGTTQVKLLNNKGINARANIVIRLCNSCFRDAICNYFAGTTRSLQFVYIYQQTVLVWQLLQEHSGLSITCKLCCTFWNETFNVSISRSSCTALAMTKNRTPWTLLVFLEKLFAASSWRLLRTEASILQFPGSQPSNKAGRTLCSSL